jgi:hypothetical protein
MAPVLVCDNPTLARDAVGPSTPTVENRPLRDAGVAQNRAQASTTVGERRHRGFGGPANGIKAPPDPDRDVGIGSCNGTEHLSPAIGCFDIADAHLQMPLATSAAADEGLVNRDGHARGARRRFDGRCRVSGIVPASTGRK